MNFRELAEKAGVSVATISRVINQPNAVLPETREKVLCVMEEVGYNVNNAKGGQAGNINAIALIIPSAVQSDYNGFVQGVISVASKHNFRVAVFYCEADNEEKRKTVQDILNCRFRGGIFVGFDMTKGDAHELHLKSFPFVLAQHGFEQVKENMCYINMEGGSYQLAKHLADLGYKNIMLLLGKNSAQKEILEGGNRALNGTKASLDVQEIDILEAGYKGGCSWGKKISEIPAGKRPDAVMCPNDLFAMGMIKFLEQQDILVPRDLAVTSLHDNELGEISRVELTRVVCPYHRLGMIATRMLFDLFEEEQDAIPQELMLQPKLEIGKSCGNSREIVAEFL